MNAANAKNELRVLINFQRRCGARARRSKMKKAPDRQEFRRSRAPECRKDQRYAFGGTVFSLSILSVLALPLALPLGAGFSSDIAALSSALAAALAFPLVVVSFFGASCANDGALRVTANVSRRRDANSFFTAVKPPFEM